MSYRRVASLVLGVWSAGALFGLSSLWAKGPLKSGEFEPLNTFITTIPSGSSSSGSSGSSLIGGTTPPSGGGSTGDVPGGGDTGLTGFSSGGSTSSSQGASNGTPTFSNSGGNTSGGSGSTYTQGVGKVPVSTATTSSGNPDIVIPISTSSPTPGASPTATSTFVDSIGGPTVSNTGVDGNGQGSSGGSSSVTGQGIFGSKGLFQDSNSSGVKAGATLSAEDADKKGLTGDLDKYVKGGGLPDQFQHGSYFAKVAGAGPIAPQDGASIKLGRQVYEFHGGTYQKISTPSLAVDRTPAQIAKLPPTISLHANLGPVPIDLYEEKNVNVLGACPSGMIVRDCVKGILADRAKQKVEGLRFMFGLVGGGSSTAIQSDGSLNEVWVQNLESFLGDIKAAGIRKIAPTPIFGGWAGDRVKEMEVPDECATGSKKKVRLKFYAGLPWGSRLEDSAPHGGGLVDAYKCSPANPTFVGWKAIHAVLETVLRSARNARLDVYELDLFNEMNVDWFTVEARMITDNRHTASGDPDLLKMVRYFMTKYGFEPSRVAYSVTETAPTEPGYECTSSYGDSARVASLSALLEAISGASFGHARDWSIDKGLGCGGGSAGRIRLAVKHNLPGIVDVHSYTTGDPTIVGVETTLWTNAVQAALKRRGLASAQFVLGETHSNTRGPNGRSCEGAPPNAGIELARAFGRTNLAAHGAILRPWYNEASSCYPMSQRLNPPLVPSR